jgi:hypothetical protein
MKDRLVVDLDQVFLFFFLACRPQQSSYLFFQHFSASLGTTPLLSVMARSNKEELPASMFVYSFFRFGFYSCMHSLILFVFFFFFFF